MKDHDKRGWTLITGGAKRLGAALTLALVKDGYPVVIHYKSSEEEAKKLLSECKSLGGEAQIIQGDFDSKEGVNDFIGRYLSRFPKTENLINNVGNFYVAEAIKSDISESFELMQSNFFSAYDITQKLIPSIILEKGSIINIGKAGLANERAESFSFMYTAGKFLLLQLTKTLAKELAPHNVRVNMVSPGILENSERLTSELISKIPMKRLGNLDEVARVVSFLLNRENSYITGQNIEVAGGFAL